MTWPQVWALMSVNYFADNIISPVYGSTERNKWRTGTTTKATTYIDSQKDTQTLAICSAAKANNIKAVSYTHLDVYKRQPYRRFVSTF